MKWYVELSSGESQIAISLFRGTAPANTLILNLGVAEKISADSRKTGPFFFQQDLYPTQMYSTLENSLFVYGL